MVAKRYGRSRGVLFRHFAVEVVGGDRAAELPLKSLICGYRAGEFGGVHRKREGSGGRQPACAGRDLKFTIAGPHVAKRHLQPREAIEAVHPIVVRHRRGDLCSVRRQG